MAPPARRDYGERMRAPAYVLQLALLATHQADAAYQHEWRVLGVPGDVEASWKIFEPSCSKG